MRDIEIHESTRLWIAVHGDGDGTPIAFGYSYEECRAHVIDDKCREEPTETRESIERHVDNDDIVYARVALRLAWHNHTDHVDDEPQLAWLSEDGR